MLTLFTVYDCKETVKPQLGAWVNVGNGTIVWEPTEALYAVAADVAVNVVTLQ